MYFIARTHNMRDVLQRLLSQNAEGLKTKRQVYLGPSEK
jgi:hypothetical protein